MKVPGEISEAARKRIEAAQADIQQSVDLIRSGKPLKAERDVGRAVRRVAAVARVDAGTAKKIVDGAAPAALGLDGFSRRKAEALQGKTVDYVGVAWLDAGRLASNAVARIATRDGVAIGTGFLVSGRLLLTNNHVIPSPSAAEGMVAEFRFEIALGERQPSPVRFAFDPGVFFVTDEETDLDYTLIALGRSIGGSTPVGDFGCCPLSDSAAKHSIGEPVNVVQHPDGDYKQVVVRENRILHRGDKVLHYLADTEPGASGSPVFNDEWQVVALHHWGEPFLERAGGDGRPLRRDVNEGVRISAIVAELGGKRSAMDANRQRLLDEALRAPPAGQFGTRIVGVPAVVPPPAPGDDEASSEPRVGPEAARIDTNYANRRGYNERFLRGLPIPMPQLTAAQRKVAARVRGMGESANPFELKYQHFSAVLNAERRMAFYSICNIDGSKHITVDRKTGTAVTGPEAAEKWTIDPRVPPEAQLSDAFYARFRTAVAGAGDFFARGHLTRREDPNWGNAAAAERANADTFHHPNGCPQVQNAFNASQAAWQGLENFILDAADDSDLRVTVITGPIFAGDDPVFEDADFGPVAIPRRFWKIVARVEQGTPLVFAVLADQSEVMDALMARREGRWDWPRRLSQEYKSTVAEIADVTGLDFGNLVEHDVFARSGEGAPERRTPVRSSRDLMPQRPAGNLGFGRFESINDFLQAWEAHLRGGVSTHASSRKRDVVEVKAVVVRMLGDDLRGPMHQQLTVKLMDCIDGIDRIDPEARSGNGKRAEVRLALRFGDGLGLPDRVPGIRTGAMLHLKGEWISAKDARELGGDEMAVLHFAHDPVGFVCTEEACYSRPAPASSNIRTEKSKASRPSPAPRTGRRRSK